MYCNSGIAAGATARMEMPDRGSPNVGAATVGRRRSHSATFFRFKVEVWLRLQPRATLSAGRVCQVAAFLAGRHPRVASKEPRLT
jgi:hypothetical protein